MTYTFEEWTIEALISLYEEDKLNLSPSYQRNDIWSQPAKKKLIESIRLGYPLPAFFLHKKNDGSFDIIDGQQRTRTFLGYKRKLFSDINKQFYATQDEILFRDYRLCIGIISASNDDGAIEDFYFRVNNFGVKLNRPEIKKSEFASTPIQNLIEELSEYQNFTSLNLFTKQAENRLADLDFISELLALIHYGITDKKINADKLYNDEFILGNSLTDIRSAFISCIDKIKKIDNIYPISKTRYRQRNDFYTLFSFVQKHSLELNDELFKYQYKLLVLIDEDISPTNDDCWAFQEYANNCVSQSNSKRAREDRLIFFEKVLLNTTPNFEQEEEDIIPDIIQFYEKKKGLHAELSQIQNYWLFKIEALNNLKKNIIFEDGI